MALRLSALQLRRLSVAQAGGTCLALHEADDEDRRLYRCPDQGAPGDRRQPGDGSRRCWRRPGFEGAQPAPRGCATSWASRPWAGASRSTWCGAGWATPNSPRPRSAPRPSARKGAPSLPACGGEQRCPPQTPRTQDKCSPANPAGQGDEVMAGKQGGALVTARKGFCYLTTKGEMLPSRAGAGSAARLRPPSCPRPGRCGIVPGAAKVHALRGGA